MSVVTCPFFDGLSDEQAGRGVTPSLGKLHNTALADARFESQVSEGPQPGEGRYTLELVEDSEKLMETLSIEADVSYSGLFTAKASMDFARESKLSAFRTYVVVKCVVDTTPLVLNTFELKPEVRDQLHQMTREKFHKTYGTHFLQGIKRGGLFWGVYEVLTATTRERQDLSVAISASVFGVDTAVGITQAIESATSHMEKRVNCMWVGGPSDLPVPNTIGELIERCIEFPRLVTKAPDFYSAICQPYEDTFDLEFQSSGEYALDLRARDLRRLGQRYLRLNRLENDFQYVLDHYDDYRDDGALYGVAFGLGEEDFVDRPLSSASPTTLLRVARETGLDAAPPSEPAAPITKATLGGEIRKIQDLLEEVTTCADRCKSGREYALPEPFVSTISLPRIVRKNMEIDRIRRALVPDNTILMWSGPSSAIPEGWALCDGRPGTPDLRGRFLVGVDPDHPEYAAAGREGDPDPHRHTVPARTLAGRTTSDGSHTHPLPEPWWTPRVKQDDHGNYVVDTGGQNVDHQQIPHSGGHSHVVQVTDGGHRTDAVSFENRPRWYAICFIIKLPAS